MWTEITTGLSNRIFISKELGILVRQFGPQMNLFIDRKRESHVIRLLNDSNIGPKLLFESPTGRVEQLLDAQPLLLDQYPTYQSEIVRKLKIVHSFTDPNAEPVLLRNLQSWTRYAKELDRTGDLSEMFSFEDRLLRAVRDRASGKVVLCHNDLHLSNILVTTQVNSHNEPKKVYLIDFEYADYNYYEFDIADHLAGLGIKHDSDKFELCLDDDTLQVYENKFLTKYHKEEPEQIERVKRSLPIFKMASHYLWSCWATIKGTTEKSSSFPYNEYARFRSKKFLEMAHDSAVMLAQNTSFFML